MTGELLLTFVVLAMGGLAYYAGSHTQEEWNELVWYAYDRQPWRRLLCKYMGMGFLALGICMVVGLCIFGPDCLSFLAANS